MYAFYYREIIKLYTLCPHVRSDGRSNVKVSVHSEGNTANDFSGSQPGSDSDTIPFANSRLGDQIEKSGICDKTTSDGCNALRDAAQQFKHDGVTVQ